MAAVALWLGYYTNWVRQRGQARAWLKAHALDVEIMPGQRVEYIAEEKPTLPWPLKLLGEQSEPTHLIYDPYDDIAEIEAFEKQREQIASLFPECNIIPFRYPSPQK